MGAHPGDGRNFDDDDARLRSQVEDIRRLLADLGEYGLLDLRWMNGFPFLHVAGVPNHRGEWGTRIIDLFRRVGEIAPGAFGLLHVWDDEDAEHANVFRVFRLVRGTLTEHADSLLSPLMPTVEDAEHPDGTAS